MGASFRRNRYTSRYSDRTSDTSVRKSWKQWQHRNHRGANRRSRHHSRASQGMRLIPKRRQVLSRARTPIGGCDCDGICQHRADSHRRDLDDQGPSQICEECQRHEFLLKRLESVRCRRNARHHHESLRRHHGHRRESKLAPPLSRLRQR
jgi:hypothetical protein